MGQTSSRMLSAEQPVSLFAVVFNGAPVMKHRVASSTRASVYIERIVADLTCQRIPITDQARVRQVESSRKVCNYGFFPFVIVKGHADYTTHRAPLR